MIGSPCASWAHDSARSLTIGLLNEPTVSNPWHQRPFLHNYAKEDHLTEAEQNLHQFCPLPVPCPTTNAEPEPLKFCHKPLTLLQFILQVRNLFFLLINRQQRPIKSITLLCQLLGQLPFVPILAFSTSLYHQRCGSMVCREEDAVRENGDRDSTYEGQDLMR